MTESNSVCVPACAPAGFLSVHTYACVCGAVRLSVCVRVFVHKYSSLWRDKEGRSFQSTDGLKRKVMLRVCLCLCVCVCVCVCVC